MKITKHIRIEITVYSLRFVYSSINNPRYRIVKGTNGFIQFGRAALIWGVS
jgi:hypothetical protein